MIAIRKRLSGQKGFTLIELLVVVAILGILATVAVPRVMDAIDNARSKKALADMTVIRDGLERFYLDYGVFPPSLDYLKGKPAAGLGTITAYIDPNFTFTNSYGNVYLYIVRWDDLTGVDSLKDYLVGDPGRTPTLITAWDGVDPGVVPGASTTLPAGLYDATNSTAYFWGSEVAASVTVATGDNFTITKNTDGSKYALAFTLEGFEGVDPTTHSAKPATPLTSTAQFTYTGQ